jgi:hypothetical protein
MTEKIIIGAITASILSVQQKSQILVKENEKIRNHIKTIIG